MEAPLHQFPVPPLPLPQDALLLQQAVTARALMMAAAGAAAGNKAPSSLAAATALSAAATAGPGQGREQCPRCASRDTKFCYYNNYNTAQPRHFCRACRRYWTLGGSLRNVPVGGSTRKRPRPARRPTRAMAETAVAAAMAAATPTAATTTTAGSPFASPATLQGAGGSGFLLSSLLLGSASASAASVSPLLALGAAAAPLLEGRLGFDLAALGDGAAPGGGAAPGDLVHHQTLQLDAGGQLLPWPAATTTATILENDRAEMTTTWKDAISVFPFPPAPAALWQELDAAAPVVEGGALHHGAPPLLL